MADLLVKLYNLPSLGEALKPIKKAGIVIRKPIGAEKDTVIKWIAENSSSRWAGESENAFFNNPKTMYIAVRSNEGKSELLGFACWDAAAKGFFGPTAVSEKVRKSGIGKALLLSSMYGMRENGYGYAVIGGVRASVKEFYEKSLPCTFIEGSEPGIYDLMY